ncbi:hypothetical protein LguiA_026379 [Lonicera macranthoides]
MSAESFVFQTAGQILGKLTTLAFREIGSIWGVKFFFKRLESTVSAIKAVLLDAAEQKKKKNRQVEDWLEKRQDVLYDIDDLLDDFMTEDLRRKVVIKGSKRKAVKNFFSSSNSLALRITMSRKLKNIRSRLEDIDADRKKFELVERVPSSPVAYPLREQTHSFVQPSDVIGRDHDRDRIIKLLLNDSSSSASSSTIENISVLPIVGLGGLGKTTLAKLVYNDDAITSNFETRLWICVSEEFDLKKLIEKIMKDATEGVDHAHLDLNQLQASLRSFLVSKKFLLVLDDVWNEERKKWTELKDLLNYGSSGSKIVGHAEGIRSLQYLLIDSCDHLESLLGGMKNLTALRFLCIYECPSLTSLPAESMRYLTSLETLWIGHCENLNLLKEEDTMMELPKGLLSLQLWDIPKLKELPGGFENAAATIKYIVIDDCPSFEILPEWFQNCTSLTKLRFTNCMLLESLPLGMHQLTALRLLHIENCSETLGRKCERETGEYWPRISQIPEIYLK